MSAHALSVHWATRDNFAKKNGAKVRRISAKKLFGSKFPKNQSLNLLKLKQIITND